MNNFIGFLKRARRVYLFFIMAAVFLFLACFTNTGFAKESLKLATTTSTQEAGILDHILEPFEKKHNVNVYVIAVGTGKALKLGENGDVDIVLVHAQKAEEKFVREKYGVNRRQLMYNDFIILGPEGDPAGITGLRDAKVAFKKIHAAEKLFISRGDDSGTHKKEKSIWEQINIIPQPGSWYYEAGQGMSTTLRMADEKDAYVLVDRGTYIDHEDDLSLKLMVEGDKDLFNQYGVIAVNPDKHKHVKHELAMDLITWLTSVECQSMIDGYMMRGHRLFMANTNKQVR